MSETRSGGARREPRGEQSERRAGKTKGETVNDERSDRMNDEPARLSRHSVGPLVTTSFGLRSSFGARGSDYKVYG